MSNARNRRAAAGRLGLEFQKRHRALALAVGEDEIAQAAVNLGQLFNDNIEFVVWVMKEFGGIDQPAFQPTKPALPKTPSTLLQ